jgi:hypothetical protein
MYGQPPALCRYSRMLLTDGGDMHAHSPCSWIVQTSARTSIAAVLVVIVLEPDVHFGSKRVGAHVKERS